MLQTTSKPPSKEHHPNISVSKRDPPPKPRLPTKRKRDTICGLSDFNKPFTIKPCPENHYDKPHTFKPVRIIGRSQLPLAFLDTSAEDDFAANQLFTANISVLEKYYEACVKEEGVLRILIAQYESKKTLYAVERVQARVYSLCRLGTWLKEKDVSDLWDPEILNVYPKFPQVGGATQEQGEWWKHAQVETKPVEPPVKRVRMSMLRQPKPDIEARKDAGGKKEVELLSTEVETRDMQPPVSLTAQEQLEGLVEHYLNAIYMSKTSLAYFAKGPINRIRNAFTSPEEGAPQTHELVEFLRSMLLSHKVEDRKYNEKLHEVIKDIPPGFFSDEDEAPKKRKSKKVKLSPSGMYPQESDVVRKWWKAEMPSGDAFGEETIDQRIKRRLADLRVREALAQMILMLEIVSLEALSTYKKPADEEAAEETQVQDGESQPKSKKRKKKIDDINLLLDLLLDKLCIWQSIEEAGVLDFDAPASKQGGTSDRLQSFCVEIIVPFYMNRVPEKARMVNKKLGGPATTSPPKRKAMKPPTTSRNSGDPKEPEPKKSRRSLARVSTDTTGKMSQPRAPSLARSTTDSALINGVKREGSEVRLSAIPFQREPSQAARRSMSQMRILKGREIDLEATSAAAAAKRRQKQRVDEEIKEAITALKKPNRGLAVGSYVDEVESRGLGSSNKSRKPTTTVRKPPKDVQVSATPRAVRRTAYDRVERTPMDHRNNPFMRSRGHDAPPPDDFCIPSSGARPSGSMVPATVQRPTVSREPMVSDTPSRPAFSKSFSAFPSAPMHAYTASNPFGETSIADTPPKAAPNKPSFSSTKPKPTPVNRTLFATPLKRASRAVSPDSPPDLLQIDATPSKKTIPSSPPEILRTTNPRLLFATPIKPFSSSKGGVSAAGVGVPVALPAPFKNNIPSATPVGSPPASETTTAAPPYFPLPPSLPATAHVGAVEAEADAEPDIFAALGWNDDDFFG